MGSAVGPSAASSEVATASSGPSATTTTWAPAGAWLRKASRRRATRAGSSVARRTTVAGAVAGSASRDGTDALLPYRTRPEASTTSGGAAGRSSNSRPVVDDAPARGLDLGPEPIGLGPVAGGSRRGPCGGEVADLPRRAVSHPPRLTGTAHPACVTRRQVPDTAPIVRPDAGAAQVHSVLICVSTRNGSSPRRSASTACARGSSAGRAWASRLTHRDQAASNALPGPCAARTRSAPRATPSSRASPAAHGAENGTFRRASQAPPPPSGDDPAWVPQRLDELLERLREHARLGVVGALEEAPVVAV